MAATDLISTNGAEEAAKAIEEHPRSTTLQQKESIKQLAEKYRERPELLDHVLEDVACPLGRCLQQQSSQQSLSGVQVVATLLVALASARGSKAIERFLPHDGRDLCVAVRMYERASQSRGHEGEDTDPDGSGTAWESRAALLDWLSLLSLSPFPLESVDNDAEHGAHPLGTRMLNLCQEALYEPGASRDRAARVLGRLLSRPDTAQLMQSSFLPWAFRSAASANAFLVPGALRTIALTFKLCRADRAVSTAAYAWNALMANSVEAESNDANDMSAQSQQPSRLYSSSPLARHMRMKAEQRIVLGLLCDSSGVPDEVEEAVDHALDACRDRDTSVRWSGAKALARIAVRLDEDAAYEIAASALALLSDAESDSAWHGGCLATAELARRRCLPDSLLEEALDKSALALVYERRQGAASVGEHVRDAGAFIAWALARCCTGLTADMLERKLAQPLVKAAALDREVHCRRAAAAAFQECAGRVGMPKGMAVIAVADYVSVGARHSAFLTVASQLCALDEFYASAILHHLVYNRTIHWDPSVRELTAQSLGECSSSLLTYAKEEALPTLIDRCLSRDLPVRHGAALAVAELVYGLVRHGVELSMEEQKRVAETVPNVERNRLYRGKGGEMMRGACCRIIRRVAQARVEMPSEQTRRKLASTVEECLSHPTQTIRSEAAAAAGSLAECGTIACESTVPTYLSSMRSQLPATQRGFAEAFANFPPEFISPYWGEVMDTLYRAVIPAHHPDERDAEARAHAMQAIRSLVKKAARCCCEDMQALLAPTIQASLQGAVDHCIDSRGDVGSWVREPALNLAAELCEQMEECNILQFDGVSIDGNHGNEKMQISERDQFALRALALALRQSTERLDRLRAAATNAAKRLAKQCQAHDLLQMLPDDAQSWSDPHIAFPGAESLLGLQRQLWRDVADGLACSAGGPGDAVGKSARSALAMRAKRGPRTGIHAARALSAALEPLRRRPKDGRGAPASLRAVEQLFQAGVVGEGQSDDGSNTATDELIEIEHEVLQLTRAELRGSGDVSKLCVVASVLAHLAAQPSCRSSALQALAPLLGHKYPNVRRAAADALYLRLLPLAEEEEEEEEEDNDGSGPTSNTSGVYGSAVEVLESAQWDANISEARKARDKLCDGLNIKKPQAVSASHSGASSTNTIATGDRSNDALASYAALVETAGY